MLKITKFQIFRRRHLIQEVKIKNCGVIFLTKTQHIMKSIQQILDSKVIIRLIETLASGKEPFTSQRFNVAGDWIL